jgi:hypothetical protein
MRRFWLAVGAFFLALVLIWAGAVGCYILATSLGWLFDRDGGGAMATFFLIGPGLGVIVGLLCAIVVGVRSGHAGP